MFLVERSKKSHEIEKSNKLEQGPQSIVQNGTQLFSQSLRKDKGGYPNQTIVWLANDPVQKLELSWHCPVHTEEEQKEHFQKKVYSSACKVDNIFSVSSVHLVSGQDRCHRQIVTYQVEVDDSVTCKLNYDSSKAHPNDCINLIIEMILKLHVIKCGHKLLWSSVTNVL